MSNSLLLSTPVLMLVTGRECLPGPDKSIERLIKVIHLAVEGGVSAIQLREKDLPISALLDLSCQFRNFIPSSIPILINMTPSHLSCHPPILPATHPPLHLPEHAPIPSDPSVPFGRSIHSIESARRAQAEGACYLIAGSIFPTLSHPDGEVKGLSFLEEVCRSVSIPVIAIGGITPQTAGACLERGAAGVAVRSPILNAASPANVAGQYRSALNDFIPADRHVHSPSPGLQQRPPIQPLNMEGCQ